MPGICIERKIRKSTVGSQCPFIRRCSSLCLECDCRVVAVDRAGGNSVSRYDKIFRVCTGRITGAVRIIAIRKPVSIVIYSVVADFRGTAAAAITAAPRAVFIKEFVK